MKRERLVGKANKVEEEQRSDQSKDRKRPLRKHPQRVILDTFGPEEIFDTSDAKAKQVEKKNVG